MSHLLHPPLLEEMGLASAIPWYVEGFTERSGIEVDLRMPGHLPRLPSLVELTVFRVLQESLTNILRHSGSKIAIIRVALNDGMIDIAVEDRGKGLDSENGEPFKSGVGMASMRERVREQGGELRIHSTKSGTHLASGDTMCPRGGQMSKRIVVVDDHDVVRQGVRLILRSRPDWSVVDEASNGNRSCPKN